MARNVLDNLENNLHDKTRSELSTFLDEARALLADSDSLTGDKAALARQTLSDLVGKFSGVLASGSAALSGKNEKIAEAKVYVKANPWKSAAIVAGAGLLVSLLLRRR